MAPRPPRRPFPKSSNPVDAVRWMMFAKGETVKAINAARARRDADEVARLLVIMEDIRRHSLLEAEREATFWLRAGREYSSPDR